MSLEDFEPLTHGPLERSYRCDADADCTEQPVVGYGPRMLCFRHGFIKALKDDSEAQHLAIGAAVGIAFRDEYVTRRG